MYRARLYLYTTAQQPKHGVPQFLEVHPLHPSKLYGHHGAAVVGKNRDTGRGGDGRLRGYCPRGQGALCPPWGVIGDVTAGRGVGGGGPWSASTTFGPRPVSQRLEE